MTTDNACMTAAVEAVGGPQLSLSKLNDGHKAAPTRIPRTPKASLKSETSEGSPLLPPHKSGESRLKRLCSDKLLAASRQASAQVPSAAAGQAAPAGSSTIKAAWTRPAPTCQPDASTAATTPATPSAAAPTPATPSAAAPAPATPSAAAPTPATPTAIPKPRSCRYASAELELRVTDSAELCNWLTSCESLLPSELSEPQLACAVAAVPRAALFGSRRTSAADSALGASAIPAPTPLPKLTATSARSSSRIPAAPTKTAAAAAAAVAAPLKAHTPSPRSHSNSALQNRQRPCQPASPAEPSDFVPAPATPTAVLQSTGCSASAELELWVTDSAEHWFVTFVPQPSDEAEAKAPSATPSSQAAAAAAAAATVAAPVPASSSAEPAIAAEADHSAPSVRRTAPTCTEALELLLAANEEECGWLAAPLDESFLEVSYGGLARKYGWDCLWHED